jgi:uncharacterized protein involved in exopolysaccharide biosynthesis
MTTAVEESAAPALTFADVVARVRRRPVVFVLPIVLGLAASLAYVFLAPRTYVAKAAIQVQPVVSDQYGPVNLSQVLNMATEQQVAQSSSVVSLAAKALGTPTGELQDNLSVDTPQETQVLNVRYTAHTATAAARGAQVVAEKYLEYRTDATKSDANKRLLDIVARIRTTEEKLKKNPGVATRALQSDLDSLYSQRRQLESIAATPVGRIITDAAEPGAPTSPRIGRDVPLGLAAGLVVGLALAVLLPSRRRREVAAPTRVTAPRRARDTSGRPSEFDQMLAAAQNRPAPPSAAAPVPASPGVSVVPGVASTPAPAPAPAAA